MIQKIQSFRGRPKKLFPLYDDYKAFSNIDFVKMGCPEDIKEDVLYYHKSKNRLYFKHRGRVYCVHPSQFLSRMGIDEWDRAAELIKELTSNGMSLMEIFTFYEL